MLSIGNELLIGQTVDTNSNWIARQISMLGWTLQRITIVRDSLDAISKGVMEALERAPRLLVTLGGLGPTHDDMTLRGLSVAIGKPLVLNETALEAVQKKYERTDKPANLTRYRRKMAMLPKGAQPLPNPVGTAPGVLTKIGQTTIFSFPGVPEEMKAIFKLSVIPILSKPGVQSPREAFITLVGIIESALAPVLEQTQRMFPGLYFKSHPKGRETGIRSLIQLHIYTLGNQKGGAIEEAMAFLLKGLTAQSQSYPEK